MFVPSSLGGSVLARAGKGMGTGRALQNVAAWAHPHPTNTSCVCAGAQR